MNYKAFPDLLPAFSCHCSQSCPYCLSQNSSHSSPDTSCFLLPLDFAHYFFLMFIFERERATEHKWGRGRDRGRHKIRSRLQARCQQLRVMQDSYPQTGRSWPEPKSDTQLSHIVAPKFCTFYFCCRNVFFPYLLPSYSSTQFLPT